MAILAKQQRYNDKCIKRIPLDVQKADYEIIKGQAAQHEETVNGYIKGAIWQRLEREGIDLSTIKSQINTVNND